MNIDEVIVYHEKRKKRAEDEGLLGTVGEELIMLDKLQVIKGKQK